MSSQGQPRSSESTLDPERYLSAERGAADLGLTLEEVYRLCRSRELPSVRIRQAIYIPRKVYARYLAGTALDEKLDTYARRTARLALAATVEAIKQEGRE